MAFLMYPSSTEVQLQLDAQDNAILAVVRGCPWWIKADVEGCLPGSPTASRVTLTTTLAAESTLRRILDMSFGIVFPDTGGVGQHRENGPDRLPAKRRSRSG